MSFFSQIFNGFHLKKNKSNKILPNNDIQGSKNSSRFETSSQYSDYSDKNSEADVNTLRMVKIMTGFHRNHNGNNYNMNDCRSGGTYQIQMYCKTKSGKEDLSNINESNQETINGIINNNDKKQNTGDDWGENKKNKNKRKKRSGITKRQKKKLIKNMSLLGSD